MSTATIDTVKFLENAMSSLPPVDLMPVIKSHLEQPNFRPAFVPLAPTLKLNIDAFVLLRCREGLVRLTGRAHDVPDTTIDANADFVMNNIVKWVVTLLLETPSHIPPDDKHATTNNLHFYLCMLLTNHRVFDLFCASPFVADCASAVVEAFIHVLKRDDRDTAMVANLIFLLNGDRKTRYHMCAALRPQPPRLLFGPIQKLSRISEVLKAYPDMKFPLDLGMKVVHYAGAIALVDVELREDLWQRNALDSIVTLFGRYLDTFPPPPSYDEASNMRMSMFLRTLSSLHDSRADVPYMRTKGWVQSLDAGLVEVVAKAVRYLSAAVYEKSTWLSERLMGLLVHMGVYTVCSRMVAVRMARELARVLAENVDGMGDSRASDTRSTPLKCFWAAFIGIVQKVTRLDPETDEVTLICMNPKCDQSYTSECWFKRCSECYSFIVCSEECWDEVGDAQLHTKVICKESKIAPHVGAWYPELDRRFVGRVDV